MMKEQMARMLMARVFRRYCEMRGFFEEDGTVITPKVEFRTFPIQGDDSTEKKITALGQLGMISSITAWELEGIDAGVEFERIQSSRQELAEPWRAVPYNFDPGSGPPQMFDAKDVWNQQRLQMARRIGLDALSSSLERLHVAIQSKDDKAALSQYNEVCRYSAQTSYLRQHEYHHGVPSFLTSSPPDPSQIEDMIEEQTEIMLENNGRGSTLVQSEVITRTSGGGL